MKSLFYFCIFTVSLTFFSCSSSDDSPSTPEPEIIEEAPLLIIKQVTREVIGIDCEPRIVDFNTNGQILEVNSCGMNIRSFIRDSDDHLIGYTSSVGSVGFGYENGLWISFGTANDTGGSFTSISYNDNIMTFQPLQNDGEPFSTRSEFVFEDASFEKPLLSRGVSNDTGEVIAVSTIFGYNDSDMTTINSLGYDPDLDETYPTFDWTFTYDDKRNPFHIGLPSNPIFSLYAPFIDYNGYDAFFYHSKHNITQQVFTSYINNFTTIHNYEYEYNEEGYPVLMNEFINGELRYKYSYEYY